MRLYQSSFNAIQCHAAALIGAWYRKGEEAQWTSLDDVLALQKIYSGGAHLFTVAPKSIYIFPITLLAFFESTKQPSRDASDFMWSSEIGIGYFITEEVGMN